MGYRFRSSLVLHVINLKSNLNDGGIETHGTAANYD
jgi:hypothetical protein